MIGFKIGELPIKYLGMPLSASKLTKSDCQILIEKIIAKIQSWARKRLSYAGRVQLLNSVLIGMQLYWASIIISPEYVISQVIKTSTRFLWGCENQHDKMPLVD